MKLLNLFILFTIPILAQEQILPKFPPTGKKERYLPSTWEVLAEAKGDLNKDGKEDLVIILKSKKEEELDESIRPLIVLYGKEKDSYELAIISSKAILGKNEGGVMGDPFQELKIERGSILLSHYGGSSTRWGYLHRFQFRDKAFRLIGETRTIHNSLNGEVEEIDTNLITGKSIITKTRESGKKTSTKKTLPKKPLQSLRDFDPRDI